MAFTLATFNVKDLFPPSADEEPAAHGADLGASFEAKTRNLAALLAEADADVLALQEIGPEQGLEAVLAHLPGRGGYGAPVYGTPDERGIRNALVARLALREASVVTADHLEFPAFHASDPPPFGQRIPLRRGIVRAIVDAPGLGAVHVFSCHFKSRLPVALRDAAGERVFPTTPRARAEGRLRSLVWRSAEALFVRGLVDAVLQGDPEALVAIMGDLNDTPDSPPVGIVRGFGPAGLSPCSELVPAEQRVSVRHGGAGQEIDHILVSAALRARLVSARFLNAELRDHGPYRPGASPAVDSDHAPVVATFA